MLLGFDVHGKIVGIIGTGKVGRVLAGLFSGFGAKLLGYDLYPSPAFTERGGKYVELDTLFSESDIISLNCPLTPETFHLIDGQHRQDEKGRDDHQHEPGNACRCQRGD